MAIDGKPTTLFIILTNLRTARRSLACTTDSVSLPIDMRSRPCIYG